MTTVKVKYFNGDKNTYVDVTSIENLYDTSFDTFTINYIGTLGRELSDVIDREYIKNIKITFD